MTDQQWQAVRLACDVLEDADLGEVTISRRNSPKPWVIISRNEMGFVISIEEPE